MSAVIDLTGMRFGRLIVRGRHGSLQSKGVKGQATWLCLCDCGLESIVRGQELRTGHTTSCGCRMVVHGMRHSREYRAWRGMKSRCSDQGVPNYDRYGGRGISVCERWNRFEAFFEDMGPCPFGRTLDRKDVHGNYEPSNCRWATWKEQQNNRSNNRVIEFWGARLTAQQWADKAGIRRDTFVRRLDVLGWTMEEALT